MEKLKEHSDSLKNLSPALCKAQFELEHVFKDAKSMHHNYATLSQCLKVIKPVLHSYELCVPQILIFDEKYGSVLKTLLIHSSGEWIASYHPLETIFNIVINQDKNRFELLSQQESNKERAMRYNFVNPVQSFGGLITYAKRYSLLGMFGLEDVEQDDDGDRFSHKNREENITLDIQKIIKKCEEEKIDIKEFSAFYSMKSSDPKKVKEISRNLLNKIEEFKKFQQGKNNDNN